MWVVGRGGIKTISAKMLLKKSVVRVSQGRESQCREDDTDVSATSLCF